MRNVMALLSELLPRRKERRQQDLPVIKERRSPRIRESQDRLSAAISDLEQTVRMRREDLFKTDRTIAIMNGVHREVQFGTFADICKYSGSKELTIRLCRHPEHAAAKTGIAKCDSSVCPEMIKAAKA